MEFVIGPFISALFCVQKTWTSAFSVSREMTADMDFRVHIFVEISIITALSRPQWHSDVPFLRDPPCLYFCLPSLMVSKPGPFFFSAEYWCTLPFFQILLKMFTRHLIFGIRSGNLPLPKKLIIVFPVLHGGIVCKFGLTTSPCLFASKEPRCAPQLFAVALVKPTPPSFCPSSHPAETNRSSFTFEKKTFYLLPLSTFNHVVLSSTEFEGKFPSTR